MAKKTSKVWIPFLIYAIVYFLIAVVLKRQDIAWLNLELFSLVLSVSLLIKHHFPGKNGIILSSFVTVIYLISRIYTFNVFSLLHAAGLFLSAAASCRVFEIYPEDSLKWIRGRNWKNAALSLLIGTGTGLLLGFVNYLLMRGSNPRAEEDVLKAFITSMDPATMEEISCRTVFYAFCLAGIGGKLTGKFQKFTGWFMMTVPHILPHISADFSHGILSMLLSWLIMLILYVLIFGIAFVFLQKKRDIVSAMTAHGIVDFIRFMLFGVPH